jgi:hypothetical protein
MTDRTTEQRNPRRDAGTVADPGRRVALARLGLGAAAVYVAPTVLQLDRSARAVQPSCTGKGGGKGNPWCKASGQQG